MKQWLQPWRGRLIAAGRGILGILRAAGSLLIRALGAAGRGISAALRRVFGLAAAWLNRHKAVRRYLHRAGVLFALLAAAVLLLSGVHAWTAPRIAEHTRDIWAEAQAAALPAATRFDPLAHDTAADMLLAAYNGDSLLGYCVGLRTLGFGGELSLLVATDPNNRITAVRVVRHNETARLGARVTDAGFLAQFEGLTTPIEEVDTISGSTVSSRAVIEGIRSALTALGEATGRGGGKDG